MVEKKVDGDDVPRCGVSSKPCEAAAAAPLPRTMLGDVAPPSDDIAAEAVLSIRTKQSIKSCGGEERHHHQCQLEEVAIQKQPR